MRLSIGIAINEPDSSHATVRNSRHQFPLAADLPGKVKRKVDDVPTSIDSGNVCSLFVLCCAYVLSMFLAFVLYFSFADNDAMECYVSDTSLLGERVPDFPSISCTHIAGIF